MSYESELVQKFYVGFYGRPADPGGLEYWMGRAEEEGWAAVREAFANSPEAQKYVFKDPVSCENYTNEELVNNIYQNLFGRDADPVGLQYYTSRLESGEMTLSTIVENIADGAQGTDSEVLENKIEVSLYFTNDLGGKNYLYTEAQIPDAREVIAGRITDAEMDAAYDRADDTISDFPYKSIPGNIFTLTEPDNVWIPGELVEPPRLMWGYTPNCQDVNQGIPVEDLVGFVTTITGLDLFELGLIDDDGIGPFDNIEKLEIELGDIDMEADRRGELSIFFNDGNVMTAECCLGAQYFEFLNNLLFWETDSGRLTSRLYMSDPVYVDANGEIIEGGQPGDWFNPGPIVLTPTENNGGTVEYNINETPCYTSDGEDLIVAGRLELLHNAYIDAADGYDILEVDAKGVYAQPVALLGIEEIRIQNLPNDLPNAYTDWIQGDDVNTYPDFTGQNGGNPQVTRSIIDLSRAIDLERLVVTEGNFGKEAIIHLGELTVVGIRGNAVTRLEGGFTQSINLHYGQGIDGPITVELVIGEIKGDETELNFAHNTSALHLVSLGGVSNNFKASNLGGKLTDLIISGDAALHIRGDLDDSFLDCMPITINASENIGGVSLMLSESENVTFMGSSGDDRFIVDTADAFNSLGWMYDNDQVVTIYGSQGDNYYEIDTYKAIVGPSANDMNVPPDACGNNNYEIDAVIAQITTGNGNNHFEGEVVNFTATVGDGNNRFDLKVFDSPQSSVWFIEDDVDSSVTIQAGDGSNVFNIASSSVHDLEGAVWTVASYITPVLIDYVDASEEAEFLNNDDDDSNDVDYPVITDFIDPLDVATVALIALDELFGDGIHALQPVTIDIQAGDGGNVVNIPGLPYNLAANIVYLIEDALHEHFDIEVDSRQGTKDVPLAGLPEILTYMTGMLNTVNVETGAGADDILAAGSEITISSGGGDDVITLLGLDPDYVPGVSFSIDLLVEDHFDISYRDGAFIQIDTGSGQDTVKLGASLDPAFLATGSITAMEGSSIVGEDITLYVNTFADLRAAELSGITRVILDDDSFNYVDSPQANDGKDDDGEYARDIPSDRAILTLTADQFIAIGAENFSVEGAIFNTHAFVKIIVTESTSLTALGVDNLPRNIDLYFEIQDEVTLTMTAEQLHTRVAPQGVMLADDGNTDYANGRVVITGGGFDFDPFNASDTVKSIVNGTKYVGGSLSEDDFMVNGQWYNVSVNSVYKGYDRPADAEVVVALAIDSDILPGGIVEAFDTWHTNLEIVGEQDVTSDGPIELGMLNNNGVFVPTNPFYVDFSALEANVNGLILDNFEMLAQGGGIYGNADNGYTSEVLIHIAADEMVPGTADVDKADNNYGFDEEDDPNTANVDETADSLVSSGVQRYIVTQIDGPTANGSDGNQATIKLCDTAQDIEVFGLRGNWNDTLVLEDAAWGLAFELQGGDTKKAEGPTGTSNVGKLDANYEWDGATAVVNLVYSVATDTRPIWARGIDIDNADSIEINAAASSTIIDSLMGNSVETLDVNADGDIAINGDLPLTVDTIDASGVVGTFTAMVDGVQAGGSVDADDYELTFIGAQGGSFLTLEDLDNADAAHNIDGGVAGVELIIQDEVDLSGSTLTNVTGAHLTDGSTLTLDMAQADEIGAANFTIDEGDKADLELMNLAEEPFALANYAEGIDVTVVGIAPLPEVTLHPDTDLTGIDSLMVPEGTVLNLTAEQFVELALDSGAINGKGTVNVTDGTQADVDAALAAIADGVTVSMIIGSDIIQGTFELVTDVDLTDPDLNIIGTLGEFEYLIGANKLTLPDIDLADGVSITGEAGSTIEFTDLDGSYPAKIDASGFNVEFLRITDLLVSGNNVDYIFKGLPEGVTKVIFNGDGDVAGRLQNVVIEEGTTIFGDISFNEYLLSTEVTHLSMNMEGGTRIDGDLVLSTVEVNIETDNLIPYYLQELIINSSGTAGNNVTGDTANIIDGDITPAAYPLAISVGSRDNNLKNVTINADQDFILEGRILFSSHGTDNDLPLNNQPNDGITANDDDEATATLTVTGSANVTIGDLDTGDDDVDYLVVNHLGDGDLTFGLSSLATIDADDEITVNGSAVGKDTIVITGDIDLSDDTLINVDAIVLNNADQAANLTITQDQFDAIYAADGFSGADATAPYLATLEIVAFDTDNFDATALPPEVTVASITLAGDMTIENSDLTGVGQIIVPKGATLNISADAFQQLVGYGTIVGVDAQGNASNDFTVNITDLTNDNVQYDEDGDGVYDVGSIGSNGVDGFNLSQVAADNITVTLGEDEVTLGEFVDGALVDGSASVIGDAEFILTNGQTLGIATFGQADGLDATGTGDTTLVYKFAGFGGTLTQIDASGYDVTTLKALAASFTLIPFNANVEFVIDDLASSVELRLYEDPLDLGFLDPTYRRVVIEEGITTPTGLLFNDWDDTDEVRTLSLTMEGDVILNGDLSIPTRTDKDASYGVQQFFNLLNINSLGDDPNTILGDINTQPLGANPLNTFENNLLNVTVNAEQDLVIGNGTTTGIVFFNSNNHQLAVPRPDWAVANFTVLDADGADGDVTLKGLDTTDPEGDITTLNISNLGTGTLTITGGSDALELDGTEELYFFGQGDIVLDTTNGAGDNGIDGEDLSLIDASGLSGDLDLGEIRDIDSANFEFTSGTGVTMLTLTTDTLDADVLADPADTGWTFDFGDAAAGSEFHLDSSVGFDNGPLNIDLGANTTLYIDGNAGDEVDLTGIDLSILQTLDIVLADGVTLVLTASQADGLDIVAGPDTGAVGIDAVVNVVDLGDTPVDLSGIAADIAGVVTLEDDDVTLDAATDLGDFTVQLTALSLDNDDLSGQIVRYNTVAQADNDVSVVGAGLAGDDGYNSSSVVWLFKGDLATPVDTSGYDRELGRLWVNEDLIVANGGDVESLFNTLPSTILRVDFANIAELETKLNSDGVDRIVELVAFTNVSATGLIFSDPDRLEHVESLQIDMGGQVRLGNLKIDNIVNPAPSVAPQIDPASIFFNKLEVNSYRALHQDHFLAPEGFINNNDGDIDAGEHAQPNNVNTVDDIGVGTTNGLDLLTVILNTFGVSDNTTTDIGLAGAQGADLSIQTITFDAEKANSAARLEINGDNKVTIKSLDISDAQITSLVIDKVGAGDLLVTGGSPAFDGGNGTQNSESLTISSNGGRITFGSAKTAPGTGEWAGIYGEELSLIELSGNGFIIDLGTIADVDSEEFAIDGTGFISDDDGNDDTVEGVYFTLGQADANGLKSPELSATGTWDFNFDPAANATMTIAAGTVFTAGGTLNLSNLDLTVNGQVDFSELTLTLAGVGIEVLAGQKLTLTAAQANGLTVTGAGTVEIVDLEADVDPNTAGVQTADLSGIMTSAGDTGTVEAKLDSTGNILLNGNLGVAHVTISGNGTVDATGIDTSPVDRNTQATATMADDTAPSFTVGAGSTLRLNAEQVGNATGAPATSWKMLVDGAGAVAVIDDLSINPDADLSGLTAATVTAFTNTVTFIGDLGKAVVTVNPGQVMTAEWDVVNGKSIAGIDGRVDVTGDASGEAVDLSKIASDIDIWGLAIDDSTTITWPVLVTDDGGTPADPADDDFQTLRLTSVQADGQTINGAGSGTQGEVFVLVQEVDADSDGDLDAFDLSSIGAGRMTALIFDFDATLDGAVDFGDFDILLGSQTLRLTGAQADGRSIADFDAHVANVTVTNVQAGQDLSGIDVDGDFIIEIDPALTTYTLPAAVVAGLGVTISGDALETVILTDLEDVVNADFSNIDIVNVAPAPAPELVVRLDSTGNVLFGAAANLTANDPVTIEISGNGVVAFEDGADLSGVNFVVNTAYSATVRATLVANQSVAPESIIGLDQVEGYGILVVNGLDHGAGSTYDASLSETLITSFKFDSDDDDVTIQNFTAGYFPFAADPGIISLHLLDFTDIFAVDGFQDIAAPPADWTATKDILSFSIASFDNIAKDDASIEIVFDMLAANFGANAEKIFLIADDMNNETALWYWDDSADNSDGTVDASELSLLGVLDGFDTTNMPNLIAANFATV